MAKLWLRAICFIVVVCAVFAAPSKPAGAIKKLLPCGLPPAQLLSTLNATVQQRLKDIWADYKNGTDCSAQQTATQELFSATEERGPKKAAYGGWGGPTFLANASDQVRADFEKVVLNNALSEEDKIKAVDEFMKKQSAELQATYNKWKADHKADIAKIEIEHAKFEKNIAEKATNLSKEAKAVFDKMQAIKTSEMNEFEKWAKMNELKAGVSPEVANELLAIFDGNRAGNEKSLPNNKPSTPANSSNDAKKTTKKIKLGS